MADTVGGSYATRPDRLAYLMNERGFTVERLAKEAGVGEKTIRRFLQSSRLRMTSITPVAQALGTTPNEIAFIHAETGDGTDGGQKSVSLRFSFEINVPYHTFREVEQIPQLLNEIGQRIHQMGVLVIESAKPGSVKIVCIASDGSDVDRFFAAHRAGQFADLQIEKPQRLPDAIDREVDNPGGTKFRSSTGTSEQSNLDADPDDDTESTIDTRSIKAIATGVAAGALIGSIVPGIGTAIGSALGGLLGGLVARNQKAKKRSGDDEAVVR